MIRENTMKIKEQGKEHRRKEGNDKGKHNADKGTERRTWKKEGKWQRKAWWKEDKWENEWGYERKEMIWKGINDDVKIINKQRKQWRKDNNETEKKGKRTR